MLPVSSNALCGAWNQRADGTWLMANALAFVVRVNSCPGDFTGDGQVDGSDFITFAEGCNRMLRP